MATRVIVFNGEIYNHWSCGANCSNSATASAPTAIPKRCLHAFLEWDISASPACAACLPWRCGRSRLDVWCWRATVWASSRFTCVQRERELFWIGAEDRFSFTPQIDRRLEHGRASIAIFSLNYVPGPWTLVEGIEKLPARALDGMAKRAVRSEEPYWRLPSGARPGKFTLEWRQRGTRWAVAAVGARTFARLTFRWACG